MARSLVPSAWFPGRDWWSDTWDVPSSRLFDQHFGTPLLDGDLRALRPTRIGMRAPFRRQLSRGAGGGGGVSELRNEPDSFQVMLDVSHFSPEEITVKTVDRCISVSARHEERMDEHGFVSREFTRRYVLPEDTLPEQVSSTLSPDGVLTITAPKKPPASAPNERIVPIAVQGAAALPLPVPVQHEP
ncbi:alpha-crystallin A chain-like [Dermacentor albipictus]|uniref:alpha-crystallin A chain-like n=1 Tax=Dermacentor albipictus TaxID=60249 RepID=UPI0031FD194C